MFKEITYNELSNYVERNFNNLPPNIYITGYGFDGYNNGSIFIKIKNKVSKKYRKASIYSYFANIHPLEDLKIETLKKSLEIASNINEDSLKTDK